MPTAKPFYNATATFTITLASLASSSTLTVGQQSTVIDNSLVGTNQGLDLHVVFKFQTGTSPSAGTVQLWAFGSVDNASFTGNLGTTNNTATPVPANNSTTPPLFLLASVATTTTSNQTYIVGPFSISGAFNSFAPPRYVGVAVFQNTGVPFNSTAGNHSVTYMPVQAQSL
jgi:hypothetical protein